MKTSILALNELYPNLYFQNGLDQIQLKYSEEQLSIKMNFDQHYYTNFIMMQQMLAQQIYINTCALSNLAFSRQKEYLEFQNFLREKEEKNSFETIQITPMDKLSSSQGVIAEQSKRNRRQIKKKSAQSLSTMPRRKRDNADIAEQKEGRNANSNLLRMFFRRLQLKVQSESKSVQTILKKHNLTITAADFYSWLQTQKIDFRNYIRVPSVKKVFTIKSQKHGEYSMVMRILLKEFVQNQSLSCHLTSKKIKKESISYNLKSIRTIFNEILGQKSDE